jgi:hypothetical protein
MVFKNKSKETNEFFQNSKSQAAMEFLMTYGWAILVVLVAIGALSYFGVLSPDRFLPSRCTLPAGIACIDHEVTDVFGPGNGELYIVIRNGLGFDMESVSVAASDCTGGTTETIIRNGGDPVTLTATGCTITSGNKYTGDINITYDNAESGLGHVSRGTLSTRVRSGLLS